MTVSYTGDVANASGFGPFMRVRFRLWLILHPLLYLNREYFVRRFIMFLIFFCTTIGPF